MASFGEELRRERELRDISLKEISDATNISVRMLEALEQNDFGELPGGAYTRGFIRCYAKHVGLNADEVLDAYHQEASRQEAQRQETSRIKQVSRPRPVISDESRKGLVGGFVAAAFVLGTTLIALIYWFGSPSRPSPPQPIAGAHGTALKSRVKKSGALPSIPLDRPADLLPEMEPPPGSMEEPPVEGVEHLVRIRALETTRVQLTCAGVIAFREELWVGSERHFPCLEPILLGAGNGGAIEYAVDSSEKRLLGQSGELVRDRDVLAEPAPPEEEPPQRSPQRPISTASPVTSAHPEAGPTS